MPLPTLTRDRQDLYSYPLPAAAAADPGCSSILYPNPNIPAAWSTSHPWPCPQPSIRIQAQQRLDGWRRGVGGIEDVRLTWLVLFVFLLFLGDGAFHAFLFGLRHGFL